MNTTIQSLGGQVRGIQQRQDALAKYYANPNYCKFCNTIIQVETSQKISEVRQKQFCNKSHAAKYNSITQVKDKFRTCTGCNNLFLVRRTKSGLISNRRICDSCKTTNKQVCLLHVVTKDDLFRRRKNWQSARSAIQQDARRVFDRSSKQKSCIICDYSITYIVAHIRSVSSFTGDTIIGVINNIENLVALCPNHHLEYDNGLLSLQEKLQGIKE